jgi:hypothetical protein
MTAEEFRASFRLVNLLRDWPGKAPGGCGDAFPMLEARLAARRFKMARRTALAGRLVAQAFGLGRVPYFEWRRFGRDDVVVIPHPSGINRWWNDRHNRARVGVFLQGLVSP